MLVRQSPRHPLHRIDKSESGNVLELGAGRVALRTGREGVFNLRNGCPVAHRVSHRQSSLRVRSLWLRNRARVITSTPIIKLTHHVTPSGYRFAFTLVAEHSPILLKDITTK